MIPSDQTWKAGEKAPCATREIVQEHTGAGLHDLRSAYACERYQQLTGAQRPSPAARLSIERQIARPGSCSPRSLATGESTWSQSTSGGGDGLAGA